MLDIARQRLSRNFLIATPFTTGRDVVRALGAVQAQDYEGAKWAVSQRTSGATDKSIEDEFAAGAILRTHVLRPTWHFIDPDDIRWMLALTGPYVAKRMAPYDRHLEITETHYRRCNAALEKALRDGHHLTRAQLKEVLSYAKVGSLGVQRAAHLLMRAELDAVICSGPRQGKQFTYALLDERAPTAPGKDRDEALLELTRRYFRTRSPATAQDFAWWSGLPMSDVKRGIELARSGLEQVTIDDKSYWSDGSSPARPPASAHLLPNYDEFFIGHRDRGAIGKRLSSTRPVTGWNAAFTHVIAIDGQLVGGWKRSPARGKIKLSISLLDTLTPAERTRVLAEVRRFEAFAGASVELTGLDDPRRAAKR
jgi:winged helix DNA-binding protein